MGISTEHDCDVTDVLLWLCFHVRVYLYVRLSDQQVHLLAGHSGLRAIFILALHTRTAGLRQKFS